MQCLHNNNDNGTITSVVWPFPAEFPEVAGFEDLGMVKVL